MPAVLEPYLLGSTVVTVREHISGRVLHEQEVTFGSAPGRVRIVDNDGYPLAVTKWGSLARPFSAASPESEQLLVDLEKVFLLLNDELGMDAFIAYGTLLGAVRNGSFIGHDNDADISYYSRHQHPADILRESYWLQRQLQERGWLVKRVTGGFIQVWVNEGASSVQKIDVFTAYHVGDWFAIDLWVRARLPPEAILPRGEIELEGRPMPAPGDPDAVLAATYGDEWRVPDPSFMFRAPRSTSTRSAGWFGSRSRGRGRWKDALAGSAGDGLMEPSDFARWVAARIPGHEPVVDVGCGLGADALWLARDQRQVLGVDYVSGALEAAAERAEQHGRSAQFEMVNFYELRGVLSKAACIAATVPSPCLYARHVIEALEPDGQENFWLMAKTVLGGGGRLFIEFHTGSGRPGPNADSLQGMLDPGDVASAIQSHGGTVLHRELTIDGAREVCRMVAGWDGRQVARV